MAAELRKEIEYALHEGLALFEMFHRLGYESDSIFLSIDTENQMLGMAVRAEGKQLGVSLLGGAQLGDVDVDAIKDRWQELAQRYNTDLDFACNVYETADAPKNAVKFITGLLNAGMKPRWAKDANEALRSWNRPAAFLLH